MPCQVRRSRLAARPVKQFARGFGKGGLLHRRRKRVGLAGDQRPVRAPDAPEGLQDHPVRFGKEHHDAPVPDEFGDEAIAAGSLRRPTLAMYIHHPFEGRHGDLLQRAGKEMIPQRGEQRGGSRALLRAIRQMQPGISRLRGQRQRPPAPARLQDEADFHGRVLFDGRDTRSLEVPAFVFHGLQRQGVHGGTILFPVKGRPGFEGVLRSRKPLVSPFSQYNGAGRVTRHDSSIRPARKGRERHRTTANMLLTNRRLACTFMFLGNRPERGFRGVE